MVLVWYPEIDLLSVRIAPDNISSSLQLIRDTWSTFNPDAPFEYSFLDDDLDHLYRKDKQLSQIFKIFTLLTITIACLGLFGLASYSAERRIKEIGIRKVLGATVSSIVGILSVEFLKLVLLANFLAWPIAYFIMNRWLQDFAYRTSISVNAFVISAFTVILFALITVSFQAVKAARCNPVESLKYE